MNFLKRRVAIDQPRREARVMSWVERGLCFTASARIGLGLAAGVPETHQESTHTHLMGGYQAKGAGHSSSREEKCA